MRNVAAVIAVVLSSALSAPAFADDTVPCENKLEDLRAAIKATPPSEADAAKITELENKGIERCNADDDARADAFFAEALKIMGK